VPTHLILDGPPPAGKEAAPLPQIETMTIPLLIIAGTALTGLSFIFGIIAATRYTASIVAAIAGLWLAFVLVSAIAIAIA
jgi:hypothetical protein